MSPTVQMRTEPQASSPDKESAIRLAADARLALRRLASAVSVVTCRADGMNHAMTATSVSALSMDPPSMLACVNRAARFHAAMDRAENFAINILSRGQASVSRACSGAASGESRFEVGEWELAGPAPVLAGAQAAIICRRDRQVDYGTHTIFMGRIVSIVMMSDVDPLIYVDGAYAGRPLDGLTAIDTSNAWYLL